MTTLDELLSPVVSEHDRAFLDKEAWWQCRDCGAEFDKPCSSHPKHHPGCTGETCRPECPMECGPVEKMTEWPDAIETPLAEYRLIVVRATLQGCIKELQANGEHQAVACIEKILTKTEDKP